MNFPVPYGFIAIFMALYFFYTIGRKNRLRRDERRERLEEMNKELLDTLRRKANKEQDVQGSDTTKAQ